MNTLKPISLILILAGISPALANEPNTTQKAPDTTQLEEIMVTGKRQPMHSIAFPQGRKASDVIVSGEKLKSRSATLGNALSGELGVHSNPFGGGASAPIIRGQEGVRVKILQNNSDVVDVSHLSPDHAVAADTLLAQQVELLRGTSTLLYAAASPAGVINVVDKRIPETMPKNGLEGETVVRVDTAAKEKATTAGVTFGIGKHLALRAEGLVRKSNNYRVPGIKFDKILHYVPDTHNKSKVGTLGLSWIGTKGHLGLSYSIRKDKYGLPGHNHMYDHCHGHIIEPTHAMFDSMTQTKLRKYLIPYPHLMDDDDIIDSIHYHCGTEHTSNEPHSHDNVYGHKHDPSHGGPIFDMVSKRYDIRGNWKQPIRGLENIRLSLAYAKYHHDELHDGQAYVSNNDPEQLQERKRKDAAAYKGQPEAIFDNKGINARLEFSHTPIGTLKGIAGVQYQTQKSSAIRPRQPEPNSMVGERIFAQRNPLIANTNKQLSLFALEQFRWRDFTLESGVRWERQRVPVHYEQEVLDRYVTSDTEQPDLTPNSQKALSYSGTFLWDFAPSHRLSLSASHNERIPSPMELYYHGKHFATNSFEYGNKNLTKERSNNFEIGLSYSGDKWNYKISTYYNRFKNYIHNENIYRSGNLFARRYIQSQARFHGVEGEIGYKFTPKQKITLFGDLVRGKLFDLPTVYGDKIYADKMCVDPVLGEDLCYEVVGRESIKRPDRHAPRVPPARFGMRWNGEFGKHWTASMEYTRVFPQNRTSLSFYTRTKSEYDDLEPGEQRLYATPITEDRTEGYRLFNAGLAYHHRIGKADYKLSLDAFNLLNQKIYIHNSHLPYVPQPGRNFVFGVNVSF